MTGSEQFQYTARTLHTTYDTRHEAVADLAKYGDWENDTVVPITENCLVRQQGSITVGPVHLGNKHWNDREIYPTTRGVTQIKQVSLVKEVNGDRDSVEESWWATDCPVCHSRLEVQGASEDSRRELLDELLDCCDIEWFPPSDWIEDCDVCGEDHRESSGCTSLTYREPFPSPEEHHYDCSECEWSGEGDDFDNSLGNCPDCGTSAVQALPVATDGGETQESGADKYIDHREEIGLEIQWRNEDAVPFAATTDGLSYACTSTTALDAIRQAILQDDRFSMDDTGRLIPSDDGPEVPEDPDTVFSCTGCDWVGPAEDVDWGIPIPSGQQMLQEEPDRCDCPECGSRVEERGHVATAGGVDRSGAICYKSRCTGEPTHRVQFPGGERWYGICEGCADDIPVHYGTVLEGLTPETITRHPVATDGGQSRDDLRWGDPELAPTHYGEHDPVSIGEDVRCAMCGARAENGQPEAWPSADEDRWEDFDEIAADGGRDDNELDHYDLLLRSMEEGLLVGVNRDDRHHTGTDELRVEYSRDDRTEVQLKRGFEDYVEIHRDRHGDLVLSELDDEWGPKKEMDVVTIEIMGIGSDPADVSEDDTHEFEQGDRFAGLPEYRWEITNRMVDVDTDDTLYHLLGVGDPNRNDTKVITESSLRENFDRVSGAGDGDE